MQQLNPGKKQGRPPKQSGEDVIADARRKRKKPSNSTTRNTSPKGQPPAAQVDKPEKKTFKFLDLTSDNEEDNLDKAQFRVLDFTSDIEEPNVLTPLFS